MKMNEVFNADLPDDLNAELLMVSRNLTQACAELKVHAMAWATNENAYRLAKAMRLLTIKADESNKKMTVQHIDALVDEACSNERLAAYLARSQKEAALELVRSLRAQLSALQSIGAGMRAEMALAGAPEPDWSRAHAD